MYIKHVAFGDVAALCLCVSGHVSVDARHLLVGAACRVWQVVVLPATRTSVGRDLPGGLAPHCLDEGPADPPAPPPACSHAVGGPEQAGGHASTSRPQGEPPAVAPFAPQPPPPPPSPSTHWGNATDLEQGP